MIGVSRTTHLQWQYLCVYIHYYSSPCFALLEGTILITKTFLLLKQTKDSKKCSIIQIPTGLDGYRRNWTPKDHPIKCCSISYILDLHGFGMFVLLFVIIISNANMIYARPNTCFGMIWNKISRRSQDIRAEPSGTDPYWWTGYTLEVNAHLLCLKDNLRWYDDGA